MADPSSVSNWTQGDTFPALRMALSDDDGLRTDLGGAESILFKAKQTTAPGTAIIQGTAQVIDPPDSDGFNLSYSWQGLDTANAGTYSCEVKVTWDTATDPDEVESWSSAQGDLPELVIRPVLVP